MVQPDCDGVGISLISLTVPHNWDVKQFFAIFWSLVPYAVLAVMIFGLFFSQRALLLNLLVLGLIMVIINEFAIKHIHDESRPSHSCLDSGGFPSGHAMIATLLLTWITLEVIIHPGWTWKKKILIIIGLLCVFGPCPPFRHPGGDHSWTQIGGGVVVGFVMGLILFVFSQFVIVRYLEYIMSWKVMAFFHIQNDYRPNYEQTKNKGAKAPKHAYEPIFSEPKVTNDALFHIAHILVISISIMWGIIGIILGLVKKHRYDCDRSSGPVTIGVGIWTVLFGLSALFVYIMAIRRRNNQSWSYEAVQVALWIGGFLIFEAFFWNIAVIETSREDSNCPSNGGDETYIYGIIWFVLFAIGLIFGIEMYILLALRSVYGWPGGISKDRGVDGEKGENAVPMDERVTAPLSPKTKKSPAIQKTKSGSIIRSRSKQSNA